MNRPIDDDVLHHLARLTPVEPDACAAESVRAQCRAALARRRRRRAIASRASQRWHVEFAIVSVAAAIYLSAIVRQAIALYGLP